MVAVCKLAFVFVVQILLDQQRIIMRVLCALWVLLTQILFKWFKPYLSNSPIFDNYNRICDNTELGKGMETSHNLF